MAYEFNNPSIYPPQVPHQIPQYQPQQPLSGPQSVPSVFHDPPPQPPGFAGQFGQVAHAQGRPFYPNHPHPNYNNQINPYAQGQPGQPPPPPPVPSYGGTTTASTSMPMPALGVTTAQMMQPGNMQQHLGQNQYTNPPYARQPPITSSPFQQSSPAPINHLQKPPYLQPPSTPQQQIHHHQQLSTSQPFTTSTMATSIPTTAPPQTNTHFQKPPISPSSAERDKNRVSALLELNTVLLQEVVNLQTQGKVLSQSDPGKDAMVNGQTGPNGMNKRVYSQEYVECMRRLQANLAYLANLADRAHKPAAPTPAGPAIMEPPPTNVKLNHNELGLLYDKLKKLFPDAKPRNFFPPGAGGMGGAGNPAPMMMSQGQNMGMNMGMGMSMGMQRPGMMAASNGASMGGVMGTSGVSGMGNPSGAAMI
ncbi:MAG: hypothetical protein M1834_009616 [Cirrosporium novae-zelandiae]|nr:MAG: hypothetical protein M1834_009616 [Cirrosporium novae-zelandiae]